MNYKYTKTAKHNYTFTYLHITIYMLWYKLRIYIELIYNMLLTLMCNIYIIMRLVEMNQPVRGIYTPCSEIAVLMIKI